MQWCFPELINKWRTLWPAVFRACYRQEPTSVFSGHKTSSTSILRASFNRTARRYPFTNICTGSPSGACRSTRNSAPLVMPMSRSRRRKLKDVFPWMRTIRATSPMPRSYKVFGNTGGLVSGVQVRSSARLLPLQHRFWPCLRRIVHAPVPTGGRWRMCNREVCVRAAASSNGR